MARLIPEVRVNKNGVPVTKHVRTEKPQPSSALRGLGAPKVAASDPVRPAAKPKARKVPQTHTVLAAALAPGRARPDKVEMSEDDLYGYLDAGVSVDTAISLFAVGVQRHQIRVPLKPVPGEDASRFASRRATYEREMRLISERRDRYAEVAHFLYPDVPAATVSKCIENGLTLKALKALGAEQAVALYSKTMLTKQNEPVLRGLERGEIPFEMFERFGIRNLNRWEKSCRVYRSMDPDLIDRALKKEKDRAPAYGSGKISEPERYIALAASDPRVLDLRLPELMWHGYRQQQLGGTFTYEEAKPIDDFIHEVRSRGIRDLTEQTRWGGSELEEAYPATGMNESGIDLGELHRWLDAGLTNEQIIEGMRSRWSLEQAEGVFKEGISDVIADGLL